MLRFRIQPHPPIYFQKYYHQYVEMYVTFILFLSSMQPLETNGQISSMTSLNGHSEDNTFAEGV